MLKIFMRKYLSLFVVLLLVLFVGVSSVRAEDNSSDSEDKVCAMDTKLCPDGSSVSRKGPSCEFAKCPKLSPEAKKLMEAKREEMKQRIETLREESKTRLEALKEGIKTEKDAKKAQIKELRITGREKALERFDKAVERLNALIEKTNTVIVKFKAKAVDTADAEGFLSAAKTKLDSAKAKIVEVNALLAASINELSLENKTKLRTLTQETQALLKTVHSTLKDAVKSL